MTQRRLAVAGAVAAVFGILVWWMTDVADRGRDRGSSIRASGRGHGKRGAGGAGGRGAGAAGISRGGADPGARPDPTGSLRLEGQVIGDQQQPIPGATVVLAAHPVRTVLTEEDGSFVFTGLLARTYPVGAFKGGERADVQEIRLRADSEPVIVRLHPGITLAVTVVDRETQAPIAGATVASSGLLQKQAATGADGVAELRGLGSWFNHVLVEAPGYSPGHDSFSLPEDPGGRFARTVALARGAPVAGVVLTPDGRGQAGAPVSAVTADGAGQASAEAGADGRWRLPALAAGEWVFSTPGLEFAPAHSPPIELDGVTARDGIELRLVAGARIAGVVVDAADRPVASAAVIATIGDAPAAVSTGADGAFEILGLARGTYTLAAREGDRASPLRRVDVGAGDVVDVRLALADATIAGVVVDTAGEPVAEASVDAMAEGGYLPLAEDSRAITDSAGRWTLGPLASSSYELRADWPDAGRENMYVRRQAATARPGDRDVRIVLPAAGTIRAAVARAGAPVGRYAIMVGEGRLSPFLTPKVVAAADGRFTRSGLPPGTYAVGIAGPDFALTVIEGIELAAGEVEDLGTIAVEAGRTVRGRVVDAAGAPVAGATVAVGPFFSPRDGGLGLDEDPMKDALMSTRSAVTGADGGFVIVGVGAAEGRRPLRCLADKAGVGRSRELALPPGDGELTLTLEATGAIAVTVTGAAEGGGLAVEATRVGGDETVRSYGAQPGRPTRLVGLVAGRYTVRASVMGPDMRSTPAVTVDVRAGETTPATVGFPRGGITMVVEVASCTMVMLAPPGEGMLDYREVLVTVQCAPGAPVELTDVASGEYRLCVDMRCQPVTVAAAPARQTFRIRP